MNNTDSNYRRNRLTISLQGFLIYSIISIISVPLAITDQLTGKVFLVSAYIGITVTTLCGFYTFILLRLLNTVLRSKNQITTLLPTLILIASVGAVRGFLVYSFFELEEINNPTSMLIRIITSTATTLFWLCGISLILNDFQGYRQRVESLIRSSLFDYLRADNLPTAESEDLNQEFRSIEVMLKNVLGEIDSLDRDKETFIAAAAHVRDIVDEVVRPLSHRLWVDHDNLVPRVKIIDTVLDSIRYLRIPPITLSGFLFLLGLFNLPANFGVERGILGSLFLSCIVFMSFRYANNLLKSDESSALLLNLLILFSLALFASLNLYILNIFVFSTETAIYSFVFIPIIIFLAILISIREITNKDRNYLIQNFERIRHNFTDLQENQISKNDAAAFLHNSLQSELLALSLQLENMAKFPDSDRARATLEQIAARINRSISEDFKDFQEAPIERLTRMIVAWEGIVSIEMNINELDLNNSRRNWLVVQIIEEAINNAVRSADAKKILIEGKLLANSKIFLTIKNQGLWIPTKNRSFGSEWLDSIVPGNWNRYRRDDWTTLEIQI